MLQSFRQVPDADLASYTGLLIAVATCGEFLSAMAWARISDKIGRKPTLMLGTMFWDGAALVFGLSRSIFSAVAARDFGRLFSANASLVQTCTGELAGRGQQGRYCLREPFFREPFSSFSSFLVIFMVPERKGWLTLD